MNALQCVSENDILSLRIICSHAGNGRQYNLEEVDYYGNTALLKACFLGRLEAAQTLLHFGANIKAINYYGQNALSLATHSGKLRLVKELLGRYSYHDFNSSSLVPALCVATLRQDANLIKYFRRLDKDHCEEIYSLHGLSAGDIEAAIQLQTKRKQQRNACMCGKC